MKFSVGTIDRRVRIVLGLVVCAAGLYVKNWFGLIGLIPLVMECVDWCLLYVALGISTCKLQSDGSST